LVVWIEIVIEDLFLKHWKIKSLKKEKKGTLEMIILTVRVNKRDLGKKKNIVIRCITFLFCFPNRLKKVSTYKSTTLLNKCIVQYLFQI